MKKFTFSPQIRAVLVGGMTQAGSTLCFNICRVLYKKAGHRIMILTQDQPNFSYVSPPKHSNQTIRIMLKQHDLAFDAPLRSPLCLSKEDGSVMKTFSSNFEGVNDTLIEYKVVNVIRDIRDCAASYVRNNNNITDDDFAYYVRNNYYNSTCWESLSDCAWIYEAYKKDPISVIGELAQVLEVELTQEQILEVHKEAEDLQNHVTLDDTTSEFYKMTKMHSNQQTNGGKIGDYSQVLTAEQIRYLETYCETWLYRYGYLDWSAEIGVDHTRTSVSRHNFESGE